MLKPALVIASLGLPLVASAANLLNSSPGFESGLTGWITSLGGTSTYGINVITYGSSSISPLTSAFGETIPADNAVNLGGEAAGTKAAYFVDDFATQTLSQTFVASSAGTYTVGYDTYVPANGFANPGDASFSALVTGPGGFSVTLANTTVGALLKTTWQATSANLAITTPGTYTVSFSFVTTGGASKDLVIDRAYVISAVPEPGSAAMMLAGIAAFGFLAARRRSAI